MPKYRKKPVVIEAVLWREHLTPAEAHAITTVLVEEWGYPWLIGNAPESLRYKRVECSRPKMTASGPFRYCCDPACPLHGAWAERPTKGIWIDPADGSLMIRTLEGDMKVSLGDWIIRGVAGEVYPCKPDIFAATYELVEA